MAMRGPTAEKELATVAKRESGIVSPLDEVPKATPQPHAWAVGVVAPRVELWNARGGVCGQWGAGQPSGLVVSRRVARAGAYMRALMVPRVSPALFTCAWAISIAVERTASSPTAWSTMPAPAASVPP